jgi:serine/threonine-protein kinase
VTNAATTAEKAEETRMKAFHTAIQAAALDPTQLEAQETLTRLLVTVPEHMTDDAKRAREEMKLTERAAGAKIASAGFAAFLLPFPLMFIAGVRSLPLVLGGGLCIVIASLFSRYMYKNRKVSRFEFGIILTLASLIVMVQGTWLGPFVLMPMAAAVTTAVITLYCERRDRLIALLAGILTIVIPFLLELVPSIPKGYSFVDGGVLLHPRALSLPPLATTIGLVYTSIGYAILPGLSLTRIRDSMARADDKLFFQAWTMKRLFAKQEQIRE